MKFPPIATWLVLMPWLVLSGQAQTDSLGSRLGEQVETTLTDPAFQQGGWEAFRLAPPQMSPSWSSGDFSAQVATLAGVYYDDNILQDNQQRLEDERFLLEPSLRLRWMPSTAPADTGAEVFYAPQLTWFATHSRYNTVNHSGGANLTANFDKTTAELHYLASLSSDPGLQQTGQNQQLTHSLTLNGTRELGGKTRLSSQVDLGYGDVYGGTQYEQAGGRLLLEYHARERLALGAGYGLRFINVGSGLRMLFNEPQAEVLWAYTDRLHFTLRAGAQISTIDGSGAAEPQTGPLVAGSLSYIASEKTSVQLDLSHQRWASYYSNGQLDELTEFTAAVTHRFSDRVVVRLNSDIGDDDQMNPLQSTASAGTYTFWSVGCLLTYVLSPTRREAATLIRQPSTATSPASTSHIASNANPMQQ